MELFIIVLCFDLPFPSLVGIAKHYSQTLPKLHLLHGEVREEESFHSERERERDR